MTVNNPTAKLLMVHQHVHGQNAAPGREQLTRLLLRHSKSNLSDRDKQMVSFQSVCSFLSAEAFMFDLLSFRVFRVCTEDFKALTLTPKLECSFSVNLKGC